mmetsp:Transcript_16123/g.23681  ORF Transcript_16123/g.23681 Transcript_16123/m.23681 type:complete len:354 (-) Transcript_16123:231-1292(-)
MSSTVTFDANLPSMGHTRNCHVAVALGRKIFVAGGYRKSTAECYDVDTKQWNEINSMSTIRAGAAAVSLGNSIVVMGGTDGVSYVPLSSAEQYDTTSGQWSAFPSMNEARRGCAAAVLNGKIIVVGGWDRNDIALSSAEEYDPTTGVWSSIPPMHTKRCYCAAAVLDGQLYVVGGHGGNEGDDEHETLSSAEVYDPTTKGWSLITSMNHKRSMCAAASLCGKVIVVGGYDGEGKYLAACEAYNPTTRQWSSIPSMQTKRYGCAAVCVDGTLYVMGGQDAREDDISSIEVLQMSTPLPKTSITSRLDALEEAAGLENDSLVFKKRIESLEMRVFGDLQEGAMRARVAKLEFEIL